MQGENVKNAFIRFENMFVIIKGNSEAINRKIAQEAVKENMPICVSKIDGACDQSLSLNPQNILYPDLFLKKKDRVKKLSLELQNA